MTINLIKLVNQGEIAKTGAKPKLPTTIPNLTDKMLDVCRIPLDFLYFNDENGRIATQIKREFGNLTPHSDKDGTDYNDKIAQFIEEDNAPALKKTKKSIKDKQQQVYGYVLQDGRIIDGNRRFTALRQLEQETRITQYFEAVILPFTYDAKVDRAQIKHLELAIQMGTEERLPYDPVDLAVNIYQTVKKDELMTFERFAQDANLKVKDVKDRAAAVELMHDFLKFCNAPEDGYYIIKDLKLYTPLYELAKKLNTKFPDQGPQYEQTKLSAFTLLSKMVLAAGDTGREIRDYTNNIINSPVNNVYNDNIEESVEAFRDKLEAEPITTAGEYRKRLETATPELREVNEAYNTIRNQQSRGKSVENFIADIRDNLTVLQDMKRGDGLTGSLSFDNFSRDQVSEIRELLIKINLISADLIEVYEDEL